MPVMRELNDAIHFAYFLNPYSMRELIFAKCVRSESFNIFLQLKKLLINEVAIEIEATTV
jgi:hypothetical protein